MFSGLFFPPFQDLNSPLGFWKWAFGWSTLSQNMEVPWKVYCNIPTIIYAFFLVTQKLIKHLMCYRLAKNKKIEASAHLAGLQNCESYWLNSQLMFNESILVKKAWLRPFITILSSGCNAVWSTYQCAEIYTVLLNDMDCFWRQNSHVQKTQNWSSVPSLSISQTELTLRLFYLKYLFSITFLIS